MALHLQQIPANAINLKPQPQEFQHIFADTIGDAATPLDGFPVIFNAAAKATGSWGAIFRKLQLCLAAFGKAAPPIATPFEADAFQSLATNIVAGQPSFNAFNILLTGKNPPGAQPAGPPVSGGGGLQPVAFGRLPQGAPPKLVTVPFQNPQNFVIHPTGIKIEQGRLQVFVASTDCGGSIPANGTCNINIEFRPLLAGHYTGLLVFNTDDPDSPYTISLSGTVTPRAVGGSGGGGIGPGVANDPFGMGGSGPSGIGGRILV